jgi:cell division protein FtsB
MSTRRNIWDHLSSVVLFLLVVAGLLAVAFWYLPLIQHNQRMREVIFDLDAKIRKEEELGKHLKSSIDALRYDPKAVERLARERLGYAKPGEKVVLFEPPAPRARQ